MSASGPTASQSRFVRRGPPTRALSVTSPAQFVSRDADSLHNQQPSNTDRDGPLLDLAQAFVSRHSTSLLNSMPSNCMEDGPGPPAKKQIFYPFLLDSGTTHHNVPDGVSGQGKNQRFLGSVTLSTAGPSNSTISYSEDFFLVTKRPDGATGYLPCTGAFLNPHIDVGLISESKLQQDGWTLLRRGGADTCEIYAPGATPRL